MSPTPSRSASSSRCRGFPGFGFPKSHAAAFALLAYQSTWLRVHYGVEFLCGLLNEQPMGFYPPDALVHEAQRRGFIVLGPDVNRSHVECRVESHTGFDVAGEELAARIGLGYVSGLAEGGRDRRRRRAGARRPVSRLCRPRLTLRGKPRRPGAPRVGRSDVLVGHGRRYEPRSGSNARRRAGVSSWK